MTTEAAVATPCFISYRHFDEDQLGGVVTQFAASLAAFYEATTGKSLAIFRDREDIGWGTDWRERIRDSVKNATVFIPLVTMRYFESESCTEELMAFYSSARQLGVTELLLPVVILGASNITSDDPRQEVQLIERLQYETIEAAWLAGYESGTWRTQMAKIANRLDKALRSAETSLSADSASAAIASDDHDSEEVESDVSALGAEAEMFGPLVEATLGSLNRFFEIAVEQLQDVQWDAMSPAQRTARLLATATQIKPVSTQAEENANELLAFTSKFDANLRALVSELNSINDETADGFLAELLGPISDIEDLSESLDQMDTVVSMLKTLSLLSFHLRQAIRPGINGVQAVRTAMSTVSSWGKLGDTQL